MIEKKCFCGNKFFTYPSKIKLGKGKYCSKKCCLQKTSFRKGERAYPEGEFKKGQMPWCYKGFRYSISRKRGKKYRLLYKPNYPNSDKRGYIREHRYVMEQKIGRILKRTEIVHHIDGDTLNNHLDNLELMDKRDHDRMNTHLNIHKRWQGGGAGRENRNKTAT